MENKTFTAVEWFIEQLPIRIVNSHKSEIIKVLEMEKEKEKSDWISGYLSCAMKDNNLPYGIQYFNLLAEKEIEAEKYYNETFNK